jgi:hypothetical protein
LVGARGEPSVLREGAKRERERERDREIKKSSRNVCLEMVHLWLTG